MWLMPFETLSLLQLHLLRNRRHYSCPYQTARPFEEESEPWNDQEWFRNRFQVLLAQDTFSSIAGALVASYQAFWEASREANGNPQRSAPSVEDVGRFNSKQPQARRWKFHHGKSKETLGIAKRPSSHAEASVEKLLVLRFSLLFRQSA